LHNPSHPSIHAPPNLPCSARALAASRAPPPPLCLGLAKILPPHSVTAPRTQIIPFFMSRRHRLISIIALDTAIITLFYIRTLLLSISTIFM